MKRAKLIVSSEHKLKMIQREDGRQREKERLENIHLQKQKEKMLAELEARWVRPVVAY